MTEPGMTKPYPWRLFGVLSIAGLLAVLGLLPYQAEIFKQVAAHGNPPVPPLPALLLAVFIQSTISLVFAIGIGLLLARKIGLGAPILSAWLGEEITPLRLQSILLRSILAGLISVAIVSSLLVWVFIPRIPQILSANEFQYPVWKRFLVCFYGGIGEEILMRLFLMSLLAWLLGKVWHRSDGFPGVGAMWTANIIAAVLFGVGHLPGAVALGIPINAIVVADAIIVNGLIGITCGWLYMTDGIEAAMMAHFSADIVLHVVGPYFVH
jgi:membrane protease YdiL (CAAX protease family)